MNAIEKLEKFLAPYTNSSTLSDEYLMAFSLGLDSVRAIINDEFNWADKTLLGKHFNVNMFNVTDSIVNMMYMLPIINTWNTSYVFNHGLIHIDIQIKDVKAFINLVTACKIKFGEKAKIIFQNKESLLSVLSELNLADLDINFEARYNK